MKTKREIENISRERFRSLDQEREKSLRRNDNQGGKPAGAGMAEVQEMRI
jgi:hypothetical protein